MRAMILLIDILDGLTEYFGRLISWLVLFMVLMTFANVVLRYVYGISNVAMSETTLYAFAITLSASAGWTLLRNEHVRVDIFYGAMSQRARALIDLLGTVFFLAPVLYIIVTRAFPYVERSWKIREASAEVAGLPYIYILKTFLLVFAAVLAIQGLSFLLRNLYTLILGRPPVTRIRSELDVNP
ncbi:MAG: TRAP transporter small permease subunit [Aestuariivita sp.]|uniref:TRAP transporter small permease subunit n=1 Tax=Aestuariivita sp. TaxID=1872407 RepID=UPI003BB15DDC